MVEELRIVTGKIVFFLHITSSGSVSIVVRDCVQIISGLTSHGRQDNETQADEGNEENAEENEEELDEILGEINDEDQTLLAAGLGGVNEEDEALHLH